MVTETIEVKKLIASEGMVITNGDIYGKVIYPSATADLNAFYEITDEEYEQIQSQESEEE